MREVEALLERVPADSLDSAGRHPAPGAHPGEPDAARADLEGPGEGPGRGPDAPTFSGRSVSPPPAPPARRPEASRAAGRRAPVGPQRGDEHARLQPAVRGLLRAGRPGGGDRQGDPRLLHHGRLEPVPHGACRGWRTRWSSPTARPCSGWCPRRPSSACSWMAGRLRCPTPGVSVGSPDARRHLPRADAPRPQVRALLGGGDAHPPARARARPPGRDARLRPGVPGGHDRGRARLRRLRALQRLLQPRPPARGAAGGRRTRARWSRRWTGW